MQEFDVPSDIPKLDDFLFSMLGGDDTPRLNGRNERSKKRPFDELISVLTEPERLYPMARVEIDIPFGQLRQAADRLQRNFANFGENVFSQMVQGIGWLEAEQGGSNLQEAVDRLREDMKDLDVFEHAIEKFRHFSDFAKVAFQQNRQEGKEFKVPPPPEGIDLSKITIPDNEALVSGFATQSNEYGDMLAQIENAKALLNGIAHRCEALIKQDKDRSDPDQQFPLR